MSLNCFDSERELYCIYIIILAYAYQPPNLFIARLETIEYRILKYAMHNVIMDWY